MILLHYRFHVMLLCSFQFNELREKKLRIELMLNEQKP